MANLSFFALWLGSLVLLTNAFNDRGQMPESWCVTYLSTYLVPVSVAPSSPSRATLPTGKSSVTSGTLSSSFTSSSPPGIATVTPQEEFIILRVVPDTVDNRRRPRGLRKRDLGGLVGSPSGICASADIFAIRDGQLFNNNVPIYYDREQFKILSGQAGDVPSGAITTTFSIDGAYLQFRNSGLPSNEAGFCQTPRDGQIYITFSSEPAGCVPVRLSAIPINECRDEETATGTEDLPLSSTRAVESTSLGLTTLPNGVVTTKSVITEPVPSSTFRWSNISSSYQPLSKTTQSSFIPLTTLPFTSTLSTMAEAVSSASSSEQVVGISSSLASTLFMSPESTIQSSIMMELTSITSTTGVATVSTTEIPPTTTLEVTLEITTEKTTDQSMTEIPTDETTSDTITTTSEFTFESTTTTTLVDSTTQTLSEETTKTTSEESATAFLTTTTFERTFDTTETTIESTTDIQTTTTFETTLGATETTNEESTTVVSTATTSESTTDTTDTTTEESTTDILTTTTFESTLDTTTGTTTAEAAASTTAESSPQIQCPSNPPQCFNTMGILCDTILGGIPLSDWA
ncbi:hypothetical protein FPOAC1_000114 [Fusarium poae]|uniref:hypothetical protein n=1 Tax=Fusarium poae TaxID=36050 RepID=UPI001CEB15E6|nr:hypothetical protein FPOAC1_000114 [Fusarium poae]KAG8674151.1 hypothetical protein FPOAC1_000114 [Fusarium poae]